MLDNLISLLKDEKKINEFIIHSTKLKKDEIGKIISMGNKETWINSIKAFEMLGFDIWKYAISDMLELLKDLNWPGSLEARKLLASININEYIKELNDVFKKAVENNDGEWLENLIWFIINNYVLNLLDIETKDKCKEIIIQQTKF